MAPGCTKPIFVTVTVPVKPAPRTELKGARGKGFPRGRKQRRR